MPKLMGINCSVIVNNASLPEYDAETPETRDLSSRNRITRYIEVPNSSTPTPFAIKVKLDKREFRLETKEFSKDMDKRYEWRVSTWVYIDGSNLDSKKFSGTNNPNAEHLIFDKHSTIQNNKLLERPVVFSPVTWVDHDPEPAVTNNTVQTAPESLGAIEIKIRRFRRVAMTRSEIQAQHKNSAGTKKKLWEKETAFDERTFKGRDISHATAFGELKMTELVGTAAGRNLATHKSEYHDSKDNPLITFRFLYRSKQALISLGLLPGSNSSPNPNTPSSVQISLSESPGESSSNPQLVPMGRIKRERSVSDLTAAEMKTEIKKLRKMVSQTDNNKDSGSKKIKPAITPAPSNLRQSIVVLDLTGDD